MRWRSLRWGSMTARRRLRRDPRLPRHGHQTGHDDLQGPDGDDEGAATREGVVAPCDREGAEVIWSRILDIFGVVQPHRAALSLANAGIDAIERATGEWQNAIYDPPRAATSINDLMSKNSIDRYIRKGLSWTWEPPYAGDGDFEWCGAFAAYCWQAIRPSLRKTYFASTYRLDRYARYGSVNGEKNRGSGRLLAEFDEHSTSLPWEPRAGDILTIGPAGSGYGKHICLVESYADGVFKTLEGNSHGRSPSGKTWQGVIRSERNLGGAGWHARRLIRPSPEDLI